MRVPRRKSIEPRSLTPQEKRWIEEILKSNLRWADVEMHDTQVVAECDCGKCRTVYLDSPAPQNPSLAGSFGYIGEILIRTSDDFMLTITLDQRDGRLSELYVDPLDLREPGDRTLADQWHETSHTVRSM
jgi:hypothetical protein